MPTGKPSKDIENIRNRRAQVPPNVKARKRQRTAPGSGACHSCGTTQTPEWRRGPDGARTLCNACGLHFAKLVRKRKAVTEAQKKTGDANSQGYTVVEQNASSALDTLVEESTKRHSLSINRSPETPKPASIVQESATDEMPETPADNDEEQEYEEIVEEEAVMSRQ